MGAQMAEQGQSPPDTEGTGTPGGPPPPEQGTTATGQRRTEGTTTDQASPGSDDRQRAEDSGAVSPTPQAISWGALSPEDRRRLLDEADPEELRKHERVAGLSGQMAERLYRRRVGEITYDDLPPATRDDLARRVRDQIRAEEATEAERQLGQAGEYYSLGQRRWDDLQNQRTEEQRRTVDRQAEGRVYNGFQKQVQDWATENFAPELLDKTAAELRESADMQRLDFNGQYNLWLRTLVKNAQSDQITKERQKWEKEDLPAYRERWLAERNGGEPSPETESGPPNGNRVLTDEVIRKMDLDEFKAVWDMKRDRPKEGYSYRSTAGIDPREAQRHGRAQ